MEKPGAQAIPVKWSEINESAKSACHSFAKPQICGCFSVDKNRQYCADTRNLRYFYERKNVNSRHTLDLNRGMRNVVLKPDINERIDALLLFIKNNAERLLETSSNGDYIKKLATDFVCFRGLLTKVACSMYLKREQWGVFAVKWNGTIYLCEEKIPEKSWKDKDKMCSWGYKFEQYMTTETVGEEPDSYKPVVESEEFCCMYKSQLDSKRLLFGAEVDALYPDESVHMDDPVDWGRARFVEFKTSKVISNPREEVNLRRKFVKWWMQSFLVDIDLLYCGFRDERGHVVQIQKYNVHDMPKLSQGAWDWRVCVTFCNMFLDMVRTSIPKETNDPHLVWYFKWHPNSHIEVKKLNASDTFLHDWFIHHMKSVFSNGVS